MAEMTSEDMAVDLIGDTGTKGAVQRLIEALEGFKDIALHGIGDSTDNQIDPQAANQEALEIDNDIRVLKATLDQFKHRR